MPYLAISGAPLQYQKANGGFASNYYLKFYAAGTGYNQIFSALNKSATDGFGNALLLDKVRLNIRGYPVGPSRGVMIPHLDQEYKMVLFQNAEAADADDISQADWVVDGVAPGLIGQSEEDEEINAEDVVYIQSGSATERTLANKLQDYVSVTDYGAKGNGVDDDTTAFTTALLSNKNIFVPAGLYVVGGIICQTSLQSIHFEPGCYLLANGNDVTLFTQNASFSTHSGHLRCSANGFTGVDGVVVGPTDPTDITTQASQLNNVMPYITGEGGIVNLCQAQCGPSVGGSLSFNNDTVWPYISTLGASRGMLFKSGPHDISTVPNGHTIQYMDAGGGNTGIEIRAGREIEIVNFKASSITSGGSPNTTATAFILNDNDPVTGSANSNVKIHGGSIVGCSRDMDIGRDDFDYGLLSFSDAKSIYRAVPVHRPFTQQKSTIYVGRVNADGTKLKLPNGWVSAQLSTDPARRIQVTHSLNSSAYVVIPQGISDVAFLGTGGSAASSFAITEHGENSFTVQAVENKSSGGDVPRYIPFEFVLITY